VGAVRSRLLLQAIGKLVAFIYRRCDLILAQSKSFIPQIQMYAAKGCRIEYFPSWAESVFHEKNSLPADEVPMKLGSFNVMFAGNIGDAQDFPAILAAAENLKTHAHIRWLIVGDGRMANWVTDEIKRRNLQDQVLMLGRHTVDRMPSFFKHADVLLVSLKDEPIFSMTIPGKLQSYLAAGIPVVAMLNGEGAELVANSRSGMTCAAGDHNGLSKAVLKLFEMPSKEREALGQNGVNASDREFHRDTLMDQIEGWLVKLKVERLSISMSQRNHVKRVFDLLLTLCIAAILIFPMVAIALAVRLTSPGPVLYWSDRVGRNNKIFKMPKFRSMRIGTPAVATHLLQDPDAFLTPIGSFLRKNSLDELPQLWSIFIGDMSFVGPRPALFNQYDLIDLRTEYGVQGLLPGITGWAQVNGRDDLCISEKVTLDTNYLHLQSLLFDMRILWLTFVKVLRRDGVSH
jgi:lipopolysaccharide/colanic/teichoic acid biosynthesis glycosyltransferase